MPDVHQCMVCVSLHEPQEALPLPKETKKLKNTIIPVLPFFCQKDDGVVFLN